MGVDYKEQYKPEHLELFFPNEILKMIIVVLCTLAILVFMVVLPIHLERFGLQGIAHEEEPADPASTPAHIRPEWYFLAVYQYLKLMPSEVLGVSGKALGILSQAIVAVLWILLPFWYPLRDANIDKNKWPSGLMVFAAQWLMFFIPSAILLWIHNLLPKPFNDIIHPMFVWPVLWVIVYILAGYIARITFLSESFRWLNVLNSGVIFIGLQALAFLVVLGQGLSWVIDHTTAYIIGSALFTASSILVICFVVSRIKGNDQKFRLGVMTALITECIILYLGLTIWAMWPHEGLLAGTASNETQRFLFTVIIMAIIAIVLWAFLIVELRTVRQILSPEERDRLT